MKSDMLATLILDDGTKFTIRLNVKPVTDTHMIYESWGRHDYTPTGFSIKDDAIIIDIGAHIGSFSLCAAKLSKNGQVYAYEPYPENFILLQQNVELNNLKNAHAFQLGVLGQHKKTKLYIDEKNDAGHSLYNKTNQTIEIECTTLTSIFQDNNIAFCDLLKIDCEGAEYEILLNTPKECFEKIGMIAMEYHDGMYGLKTAKDIQTLLEDNGFSVKLQTPGAVQGLLYARRNR
jgi:FkbM family methyltransferase